MPYKKYLLNYRNRSEWDIILCISENGSVFSEPKIVESLKGKKIVLICSYNSTEGKDAKLSKLLMGKLADIKQNILHDENSIPIIKLLSYRNHNQHILLFCKVNEVNLHPVFGIYYQRRLMSKRVSPLVIPQDNGKDLGILKSIFYTYFERAVKEDCLLELEKKLKDFQKAYRNGEVNGIEHEAVQSLVNANTYKLDVEQYLIKRFLSDTE
jgi:hypothetical protein